jgi:hypothetical protein
LDWADVLNERFPQPPYGGFESDLLIMPRFVPIFLTVHFSTFATKSARSDKPAG